MLVKVGSLANDATQDPELHVPALKVEKSDAVCVGMLSKPSALGELQQNTAMHYYSTGSFNLIQLLLYILKQTGPASVFIATYSISDRSITTLRNHLNQGAITDIRFLLDNRVRSISPHQFDHLVTSFPGSVRCMGLHAKVALVYNRKWKVSVIGSQNATHNPKLERGIIHTLPEVFDFDLTQMNDEFDQGTT